MKKFENDQVNCKYVMRKRDLTRFEFKMGFRRTSYIAKAPWQLVWYDPCGREDLANVFMRMSPGLIRVSIHHHDGDGLSRTGPTAGILPETTWPLRLKGHPQRLIRQHKNVIYFSNTQDIFGFNNRKFPCWHPRYLTNISNLTSDWLTAPAGAI